MPESRSRQLDWGLSCASVECHCGGSYGERPTALIWQGERLPVAAVEARWRQPEGRRFRVRTADGRIFALFYSEPNDTWQLESP